VGAEATGSTIAAASAPTPALLDYAAARSPSSTTPFGFLLDVMANNLEAGSSTGGTALSPSLPLCFYLD
jgi:hypothetical protein